MSDFLLQRRCPKCGQVLIKATPTDKIICRCGWVWMRPGAEGTQNFEAREPLSIFGRSSDEE